MKLLQRCCSLLLCFALLLVASSVTAKAEEIDVKPHHFYSVTTWESNIRTINNWTQLIYYSNNGTEEYKSGKSYLDDSYDYVNIRNSTYIKTSDNSFFIGAGKSAWVTIENVTELVTFASDWDDMAEPIPHDITGFIIYTDGSIEYVDPTIVPKSDKFDVKFYVEAQKDVLTFCYTTIWQYEDLYDIIYAPRGEEFSIFYEHGELQGDKYNTLRIDEEDKTDGLLQALLDKLGTSFGSLEETNKSGFKSLGEKLSQVWDAIVNLPAKIWEFFADGLKSLFVPSDEFIVDYKEQWEEKLADKLGAVWQVTGVLFDSFERIQDSDEQDTIAVPEVVIPLPEGNEFAFGGGEVRIVPEGFEFLATACKTAMGIGATLLFINGLRRRYDEVMGVEK